MLIFEAFIYCFNFQLIQCGCASPSNLLLLASVRVEAKSQALAARTLAAATAAHDGLAVFGRLSAMHDLRLRGAVVSVGTTSLRRSQMRITT